MDLSNLPKIKERGKKRLGRGKRDARGAKSGRGTKGSLKRGKMPLYFEGGTLPLTKRIPMLRGKGKNKPVSLKPVIINLEELNKLRSGTVVTVKKLYDESIIGKDQRKEVLRRGIKILARGELKKKLKIKEISLSAGAKEQIKKIAGEVIRGGK